VLVNASAFWEAAQLGDQLGQAMQSRAVIEQAKGILMARSPQVSAVDAFDLLRKASQRGEREAPRHRPADRRPQARRLGDRRATRPTARSRSPLIV